MNKQVLIILQLCYLALFARLMYLWVEGILDRKSAIEGVKILLVLVFGTTIAAYITSKTGQQLEQYKGLICDRQGKNVWMCGGWPIFWDGYAQILASLRTPLLSFMSLPALCAPVIANLYMARKIAEAKKLEGWEVVRIMGGSFIVYFALTHAPMLLGSFEALAKIFKGADDAFAEGKGVMIQWVSTINQYLEILPQLSWTEFPVFLALGLGLVALTLSLGSTLVYLYQLSLLAMLPIHFFEGLMQDKARLMLGFRKIWAVALIGLWTGPIWTVFSKLPKLSPPVVVGGTLAYSDADYWSLVGLCFAAFILLIVYYGGLFFLCISKLVGGVVSGGQ